MVSRYNRIGTHRLISGDDTSLLVCCNFDPEYFESRTLPICYNKIGFKICSQTEQSYHIKFTGVISREHGYNYLNMPYKSEKLDMMVMSVAQPEFGTYTSTTRSTPCVFLPGRLAEYDYYMIRVPISKFNDFVQLIKEYNEAQEKARKDVYLC